VPFNFQNVYAIELMPVAHSQYAASFQLPVQANAIDVTKHSIDISATTAWANLAIHYSFFSQDVRLA
jgi:hypothetical protein